MSRGRLFTIFVLFLLPALFLLGVPSWWKVEASEPNPYVWSEHQRGGSVNWDAAASSADGTKLVAFVTGGYIYTSDDSGSTWIVRTNAGSREWSGIASSSDGTNLVAVVDSGYIYTSHIFLLKYINE